MSTCGDFGGRRPDGSPCGVRVKGRRCRHHTEAVDRETASKKARFLKLYEEIPVQSHAAQQIDVSTVTVWRWRQADPEFDQAVTAIDRVAKKARTSMLRDATFVRALKGKASAAETIFLMVNESGGEYKHVSRVEVTGGDGGPVRFGQALDLEKLSDEELDALERICAKASAAPPDAD